MISETGIEDGSLITSSASLDELGVDDGWSLTLDDSSKLSKFTTLEDNKFIITQLTLQKYFFLHANSR